MFKRRIKRKTTKKAKKIKLEEDIYWLFKRVETQPDLSIHQIRVLKKCFEKGARRGDIKYIIKSISNERQRKKLLEWLKRK